MTCPQARLIKSAPDWVAPVSSMPYTPIMEEKWFSGKVRRNLVDMHIEAWDERFMSAFDPAAYVTNLRAARVQAAMVYANSHVGYCYWPTNVGALHPGLKGRNVAREIFDACHAAGIDVVLYYSLVYDNWAYEHLPTARIVDATGRASREPKPFDPLAGMPPDNGLRYGLCCPNSPEYRRYTENQVKDFCSQLDFEGVFFDMTFWPVPCYCGACADRYRQEVGGPIPEVVDWNDQGWRSFQKKREDWLVEFGTFATAAVKRHKPCASVNHQFSTAQAPWIQGVTERQREFCDYLGGDFYEDFAHQAFFCKLFRAISPSLPFEFHTSRCTTLADHTTMKSMDELRIMNALTFVHQGATLFIDAIDPVGTMNPAVYQRFGRVFEDTIPLEPFIGGEPLQDVAVYFSMDSKMDTREKPTKVTETLSSSMPHRAAAKQATATLGRAHLPCGVIGKSSIGRLDRHQVLVLADVQVLGPQEADAISAYVRGGGALYASGFAAAEALGDVLGVRPEGFFAQGVSYMTPTSFGLPLMPDVGAQNPLMVFTPMVKARALDPAEIAATVTLPYTDPNDPSRFASIHSNPPGLPTGSTALVMRRYGKGRALWSAASIESHRQSAHRAVFSTMIRSLMRGQFSYEISAPPAVEAVVCNQAEEKRIVVSLVNVQELLPPVPVCDIRVRLRAGLRKAMSVRLLPNGPELEFATGTEWLEFVVPRLDVLSMVSVTFK
jgi:hypothetical protein